MIREELLNLIGKVNIEIYVGKFITEELNREFYISRILALLLKKFHKEINLPESDFICKIYRTPYIFENGDRLAPFIKINIQLIDGRIFYVNLTHLVIQNHIDDLYIYIRERITESLAWFTNQ